MIQFGSDIYTDLKVAGSREWLETNGIGGFASSTIIGLNTRRYHGLLTAATKPPVGRLLLLSKLEETLILDGRRFELSANQYPGVIHPQGYPYLKGSRLDPFPIFTYEVGGVEIEKSIFMIHGENSTVVMYTVKALPTGSALLRSGRSSPFAIITAPRTKTPPLMPPSAPRQKRSRGRLIKGCLRSLSPPVRRGLGPLYAIPMVCPIDFHVSN